MEYDIGMVGLGVMGRNLVLNMADHGYSVAGYDRDPGQVKALQEEAGTRAIRSVQDMADFVRVLRSPRAVMMLVPAGPPVDAVIQSLLPGLASGDLIIDGGNSYFKDTDLRAKTLADKGILYMGMGISGGEYGARHGPSMMPGGPQQAYERVRPILEAIAARAIAARAGVAKTDATGADAARAGGEPCVAYMGPGSAGHYVKMVHNGIEYGLMQLIAETYDLMKQGLSMRDDELATLYATWNQGELDAYLIEITAHIFREADEKTGKRLIDEILDEAKQKGTGQWTSQSAMDLQVPLLTIDAAVAMRDLSALKAERETASQTLTGPAMVFQGDREAFLNQLRNALYAGTILTFAQGMALLRVASQTYDYGLDLATIARIWCAGCIIHAALLEKIDLAYHAQPDLPNLLMDSYLGQAVAQRQTDLRAVIRVAVEMGIPAPAFMASLSYFDGYRSAWLPANLIQAQRDYFGAHTYERVDTQGVFHTHWIGDES